MSYFMAEYAGKFRFIIEIGHDAPGKVDIATWQGKGIDEIRVDYFEFIFDVLPVGNRNHLLAYLLDILLHVVIVIQPELCNHLGVGILAHLYFLLFRHEHNFLFSCNRISCASVH